MFSTFYYLRIIKNQFYEKNIFRFNLFFKKNNLFVKKGTAFFILQFIKIFFIIIFSAIVILGDFFLENFLVYVFVYSDNIIPTTFFFNIWNRVLTPSTTFFYRNTYGAFVDHAIAD